MRSKRTLMLVLIVLYSLISAIPAQAAYNSDYYFPWKNGVVADLTTVPTKSGHINQVDFVIGGTGLGVTDRQKQDVVAAKDGVIVFARDDSSTSCNLYLGKRCDDSANLVVIRHPGTTTTWSWYWHLAPASIPAAFKKAGTPVRHGEVIGKQGKTGTVYTTNGNGVHLHFFVSKGYTGPTATKRLPSIPSGSIISVTLKNNTTTYAYSQLKLQRYTSYNNPKKFVEIKSNLNGYCLDMKDGVAANGTRLQLWYQCVRNNNQKWEVTQVSSSIFLLRNPAVNSRGERLCIDVTGGNPSLPVQVYGCGGTNANQQWQLVPLSEGIYQIKNRAGCLVPASTANQANAVLRACSASDSAQKWKITDLP